MPNALVIGPNGFLGQFWCEKLAELNFEVYGVGIEENAENLSNSNYIKSDLASNLWFSVIREHCCKKCLHNIL